MKCQVITSEREHSKPLESTNEDKKITKNRTLGQLIHSDNPM